MSREAEITQFSFGEEAEEYRTSVVDYGEGWGGKKAFPLNFFSGLMDYSYQYELKQHHFSGIVHLQLI